MSWRKGGELVLAYRFIILDVDGTQILLRRRHLLEGNYRTYLVALLPAGFSENVKIFQLLF